MHIVAVAWIFVVVLMSLAEATSPQGSVLGAFFTLVLYGVLPLTIVLYVMGTPARRRARRAAEAMEHSEATASAGRAESASEASSPQSNGGGQAAGDPVSPERKEA